MLALMLVARVVCSAPMWEAGELHYPQDQSEVSAFINTQSNAQLQTVLCARNLGYSYRFTLLLPKTCDNDLVIQVGVSSDTLSSKVYAEVSGNSIEFQINHDLIISLTDSPVLTFEFDKDDAEYLGLPATLQIPMTGSDLTIRKVASECTALCLNQDYKCNKPLVSAILWPPEGFKKESVDVDYDALCTEVKDSHYEFKASGACKVALDRFYRRVGVGPLSFISAAFRGRSDDADTHYEKYRRLWDEAVELTPGGLVSQDVRADDEEWYLMLYSLIGRHTVTQYSKSYFDILKLQGDPTTFIYDTDNRYELETLKYTAVLSRRVHASLNAQRLIADALKEWNEFYHEFAAALPQVREAQALRPLVYRTMLMRIWRLAGKPAGVNLRPEYAFVQGSNGRNVSGEYLEAVCSFFDGENGYEYFYGSPECVRGVASDLRQNGLRIPEIENVYITWDRFAAAWQESPFYADTADDAVGAETRSKLSFMLLTLYKIYGFGDYFLTRQCISSHDADICAFELEKAFATYEHELENRDYAIAQVDEEGAATLEQVSALWMEFYNSLCVYVDVLAERGQIPQWRASLVKSTALVQQTNALLNLNYDREELPDESLEDLD